MTIIIDPAGLGDYTTLALANAANPVDGSWECWQGDVGGAGINAAAAASIHIYSRLADRVNKLVDAGTAGFSYCSGNLVWARHNVKVEGMRAALNASFGLGAGYRNIEVIDNQIVQISGTSTPLGFGVATAAPAGTYGGNKCNGNVFICEQNNSSNPNVAAITAQCLSNFAVIVQIEIIGNTILKRGAFETYDYGVRFNEISTHADSKIEATVRNNAVFGATACYGGAGTIVFSASNNAASDGTATSFLGGSGNLDTQTAADWFADPDVDATLKAGSPGIGAGDGVNGNNIGADQATTASSDLPSSTLSIGLGLGLAL